jgi:hypothetical protein
MYHTALPVGKITAQMQASTATMTTILDTLERRDYVRPDG